ncbi:hypothetical protein D9619_004965 [Psilocybe cf. subviscida]|uniref:NACHT domain-containing protein n=1 Tax=Psilocybe cf. subviscida TaxID=2480587 RepID=A0A8H5BQU0_9AGAR|nr:hypothetical protein D9619_004965 [Psilocybe cf. subviscida]
MFTNARNIHISGAASFVHNGHNYNVGSSAEALHDGIRLLVSRAVKGAMHNSGERFDAPTCHEETRTAIQEDLLGWADELVNNLNRLVTWLYGPAGAGKSAIAQTIAQKLDARGQLTASFFFSRASGSSGRGAETDFVATLAYQLSQSVPATKPHIAAAVRDNPLVLDLALQDQVDRIIVAPLIAVSKPFSGPERPMVVVVDGLDECRREHDAQRRVVDALILGLCRIPHHTHKLFITSRPEHKIVAIFGKYEGKLLRRMELDNKWNPDRDIRTFLNASFADIRRSHFYFHSHPVDERWPGPDAIETLVRRSSGQFIYASVVLKYIKSDENYSPVARLGTILSLDNDDDRPYAELDALYEYAFSQIQGANRLRVLTIISLEQGYHKLSVIFSKVVPPLLTFLSEFMGIELDEIKFYLLQLASLLVLNEESGRIHYMHASLLDFLKDQTRSGDFYINTPTIGIGIVGRAVELLEDGTALKARISTSCLQVPIITLMHRSQRPTSMAILIAIPPHYANMLPPDQKFRIYSLVSNFDIVETVLCKIDTVFIETGYSALALNNYVKWVLEESKVCRYLSHGDA